MTIRILVAISLLCIMTSSNAVIVANTVLQHPKTRKQIYCFHDLHIGLPEIGEQQLTLIERLIIQLKNPLILCECSSYVKQQAVARPTLSIDSYKVTNQGVVAAQRICKDCNFTISDYKKLHQEFLVKLALQGSTHWQNFLQMSDQERIELSYLIQTLFAYIFREPLMKIATMDTPYKDVIVPPWIAVEFVINGIRGILNNHVVRLRFLTKDSHYASNVAQQLTKTEQHIQKITQLANRLTKWFALSGSLSLLSQQVIDRLQRCMEKHRGFSKEALQRKIIYEFTEMFLSPEDAHTWLDTIEYELGMQPFGILDTEILTKIVHDNSSRPIIIAVGGLHAELLTSELLHRGYKFVYKSPYRLQEGKKITSYGDVMQFAQPFLQLKQNGASEEQVISALRSRVIPCQTPDIFDKK